MTNLEMLRKIFDDAGIEHKTTYDWNSDEHRTDTVLTVTPIGLHKDGDPDLVFYFDDKGKLDIMQVIGDE